MRSVKEFEDATGLTIKFGDVRAAMAPPSAVKTDEKKEAPPQPAAAFGQRPKDTRGFALVIRTAPNELVVVGSGVVILNAKARLGTIDEVVFEKGQQVPGRRMNGDETFSGNLFALDANRVEVRKVGTYTLH